ncbi:MAG: GGDEF domain-containing protein [Zetaproteobacteria bacterium]|nr:MAG: GGDEF domain-containing protein [Zetaproteobacteria bacterium]
MRAGEETFLGSDWAVLCDRLERLLKRRSRRKHPAFSLLSLGIRDADHYYTALGEARWRRLLRQVGQCIQGSLRASDYVATLVTDSEFSPVMHGGRFFMLLEQPGGLLDVCNVAQRVRSAVGEASFTIDDQVFKFQPVIGIALPDASVVSGRQLIERAMQAEMLARKEKDEETVRLFDPEMQREAMRRIRLEAEIRKALQSDEFTVFFQPIVELASEEVVGCEGLVRWKHGQKGMVSPAEFIPLAEESGLIADIDRQVFGKTCKILSHWRQRRDFFVSLNVSVKEFGDRWSSMVVESFRSRDIRPENVHFELTESLFLGDTEQAIRFMKQVVAEGGSFAIDDFGTGFSCLSYLRRLPVKYLKIDKSFIDDLATDRRACELVDGVIQMGHRLGMEIVAEGVENVEQVELLKHLGCDCAQGFYYGRPAPVEECHWL